MLRTTTCPSLANFSWTLLKFDWAYVIRTYTLPPSWCDSFQPLDAYWHNFILTRIKEQLQRVWRQCPAKISFAQTLWAKMEIGLSVQLPCISSSQVTCEFMSGAITQDSWGTKAHLISQVLIHIPSLPNVCTYERR